jgi:trehalose 2-sulfotransferase
VEILTSYIIASVQRSGTHLLCSLLRSTGVAGFPAEHFLARPGETWESRWHSTSRTAYVARVLRDNTTPNAVFGTVAMWSYFERMLQMLRDIPEHKELDGGDLIEAALHEPKYIWLRRRNRVEQAVSWAIACQTGVWAQRTGQKPRPRSAAKFDFKVIDEWCNRIAEHEAAWAKYFRENRIDPLTLFYEDVVASNRAAVETVLEYLRIPLPADVKIVASGLEKQANELSEQWTAAYLKRKKPDAGRLAHTIRRIRTSMQRNRAGPSP